MEEHVYIQHMQCQKWPGLAAVQAEWCWQVQAPKCLLLGTSQGNVFPPRGLLLSALPLVTVTGLGAEVREYAGDIEGLNLQPLHQLTARPAGTSSADPFVELCFSEFRETPAASAP